MVSVAMSYTNATSLLVNTTLDEPEVEKFSSSMTKWSIEEGDNSRSRLSNRSGNTTTPEVVVSFWPTVVKTAIFGLIIVGTIVGNLLVCAAICLTRKLRTASNLLIVSLAASDLLVGTIDMPFAVVYEAMGQWIFGQTVCDLWTSVDVLVCTASILNLCMISIDRYLTVTKPFINASAAKRNPVRIFVMIAVVWILSTIVSVPPLLGWKAEMVPGECEVSQDKGYQFFATICSFYLPLGIMMVVYTKLYLVSSRLAKTVYGRNAIVSSSLTPNSESVILAFQKLHPASEIASEDRDVTNASMNGNSLPAGLPFSFTYPPQPLAPRTRQSRSQSLVEALLKINCRLRNGGCSGGGGNVFRVRNYDRKATRTLGVIMGAFVACWLPFFILAVTKPFVNLPSTVWCRWLSSLFLWLGYTNSLLNPIIYARFNRDFRTPFKCILQCRCASINSRLRSEDYVEQFGHFQVGRSVSCFHAMEPLKEQCTADLLPVRTCVANWKDSDHLPASVLIRAGQEMRRISNGSNKIPAKNLDNAGQNRGQTEAEGLLELERITHR